MAGGMAGGVLPLVVVLGLGLVVSPGQGMYVGGMYVGIEYSKKLSKGGTSTSGGGND
jgi:hypothetical protein